MFDGVKKALREACLRNGFSQSGDSFRRIRERRHETTITLYPTYFEVYIREYPAKEGWSRDNRQYTYKNAENAVRW